MTGNEIREKFLEYFERHGHTRVRSSPLLPANDPTLLFTNAGMNQFKDVFLGAERREYLRACSSQKCLRAGGKHNDLDEVGKTARHHTFFEMLGNFSFGEYFKEDAIKFAWDLLVNELKLDPERMWFSVFGGDEEVAADEDAEKLWAKVGAAADRILRFGRSDNFWQMGETGPCGPCSEIHYYMGPDPGDAENCAANVNGAGDTIMEIWNLVFMQFQRSELEPGKFKLDPLPAPSVDTGAGLERLAVVLQGVKSNYDTDLILPIIKFTAKLADRHYEPETQEGFAMRVIADHARATAFAIADGILPGNEGRNYVLRKIMRRAIYQGRHTLGFNDSFFNEVTNFVVDQMKETYPELENQRDFVQKMVALEEQRFGTTLTVGLNKLDELFAATGQKLPDFKQLARLYDTFGIPRDLIRVALEERGFGVTEEQFNYDFDEALRQIQSSGAVNSGSAAAKVVKEAYGKIAGQNRSQFRGYDATELEDAHVVALLKEGAEVAGLESGEEGEVVLDQTPFYAESGGQVGDVGRLIHSLAVAGGTDFMASIVDTYSPAQGLIVHKVKVEKGKLKVGDIVTAEVDVEKRDATRR
ncbi:MAG: alanine--tRNA ligase, partial [Pyrinomonadaceae bacterium]